MKSCVAIATETMKGIQIKIKYLDGTEEVVEQQFTSMFAAARHMLSMLGLPNIELARILPNKQTPYEIQQHISTKFGHREMMNADLLASFWLEGDTAWMYTSRCFVDRFHAKWEKQGDTYVNVLP